MSFRSWVFDFNGAQYFSSKQMEIRPNPDSLDYAYENFFEIKEDLGLDMTIPELLSSHLAWELDQAIDSGSDDSLEKVLKRIIGLGRGLTSSGDDLLFGMLFINGLLDFLPKEVLQLLEEFVTGEQLTTDISIDYSLSTLEGSLVLPF